MVVSLQTLLDRSNKNMDSGTHKVVRESALEMIRRAYKEGIYVQISEGNRSNARQQQLYNQGRTTSGNVVTNAKPGQSLHNYGTAVDFFLVSDDGSKAIWTVNAKWRRAAAIGKSLGFEWGGDWTSFKDYPHLQMMGGLSLADLQAGKRPNLTSKVGNSTYTPPKTQTKPSNSSKVSWKKLTGNWIGQTLKKGEYGKPVIQLQNKLGIEADSYFGEDTEKAVRDVQKGANITVDGLAGKATYNALLGANLTVDGKWGKAVTRALQKVLGTPVDGVISKQPKNSVSQSLYGNTVQFGSGGSNVIVALQKKLGVNADGKLGPATIKALQRHLGTTQDGVLSRPSLVVKELQRRLNNGTF